MFSKAGLYSFAWFCFLIEAGSVSFLRKYAGIYTSPVIFLLSSIFLTLFLLKIAKQRRNGPVTIEMQERSRRKWVLIIPLFLLLVIAGWLLLRSYFPQYPIDPGKSDIIPLVRVLTHRFSSGATVYGEINEFGYAMYPNYLPMTWLPFIVADWLHLDYRTWAYIIFSGCVLCLLLPKQRLMHQLIFLILPFLIFILFLQDQPSAFGWTIEPMIAGFYLLLLYGLYKKQIVLIAVALTSCLLSRYAVVMLLPFLFIIFFYFIGRQKALLVSGLVVLGVLLLFVFPFLLHQPDILLKSYDYYTKGALGEWKGQSWQQPGTLPFQLSQGYGFAIFFYRKENITNALLLFQKIHLIICFFLPLLSTAWYFIKGRNWLAPNIFLVLLLHLYLAFFFAFIQVPYAYLFFTPLIISGLTSVLVFFYPFKN